MTGTLEMSQLSWDHIVGPEGLRVSLSEIVETLRYTLVDYLDAQGKIRYNGSFGFAMADPALGLTYDLAGTWDDPREMTLFVAGWGPERERYCANAVRKLRAAARNGVDTLDLVTGNYEEPFCDIVESPANEDGTYPWGDFPYGGAVFVGFNDKLLLGAVSGLRQEEDHALAGVILHLIGLQLFRAGHPIT